MFAELLARSCFSFLRGASHPEELVSRAKQLELGALALCDRDGLYGAVRAFSRAREIGQRIIVGAELTVACGSGQPPGAMPSPGQASHAAQPALLALLVDSHQGYANLCRLLTRAHADQPKGRSVLELEWLARHHQGLFAIVPAPRQADAASPALPALLAAVSEVFPKRGALGMYRHLDGFDAERERVVRAWSERYALPIVASARPLFHHRSRKRLADVLYCIRTGTTLDRAGSALAANAEAHLRSAAQMQRLFSDQSAWVERTGEIASGLSFSLGELDYRFPCELASGESAPAKLRRLTFEGARRRYRAGVPQPVIAQLEKELALIEKLGMASYFLCTWEIVEMARRRRILCQGRGSAANSAVCYVLGITAVDPARSNLLFERFMSEERAEPPDIDIDFEHERREQIIQDIYARYGRDRAAMVCEVICYRGKSALRETGKAFGLSLEQVERLSSTITHWDTAELSDRRLHEVGLDRQDGRVRQVIALARQLQGFPRHLSVHVGGFVLCATSLCEVAPVEPARMQGRTVVPWDKDDLETLGFFKVDVLGLGMLTAIRKCLALIAQGGGLGCSPAAAAAPAPLPAAAPTAVGELSAPEEFDPLEVITRIPPEAPAVYELVSRADTVGVFQIESRAQMAMLPRLRPRCFYDLVIEVAIVRPGPIQGGMVHPYLRRRNGEEAIRAPHPDLWPILERTLGVPLFQEQVMQIAIVGAGYSGGEADQLRRDMAAWKKHGKLSRHRPRLLAGFADKGIEPQFGAALFEQIKGFGDYGFPESHAASFALLVYASAWQKAHYPAHFACALLNSQPMGFYSPSAIVRDAQQHGVEVRDVCVLQSNYDCTLEAAGAQSRVPSDWPGSDRALRLGLRLVKGLGRAAALRVEAARPFAGLDDLARRARLRQDEVDALAEAGALEALVAGRRQALWQSRAPRAAGLFESWSVREPKVQLPALRASEKLVLDYRRKGLSVHDHPLCHLRRRLRRRRVLTASELGRAPAGRRARVAGLVTCRQQPVTASGVVFITLEDETGQSNLILSARVFDKFRLAARYSTLLLATGRVERQPAHQPAPDAAVVHLIVSELERLDTPEFAVQARARDFR
jgi:error-prone DNA polymerase